MVKKKSCERSPDGKHHARPNEGCGFCGTEEGAAKEWGDQWNEEYEEIVEPKPNWEELKGQAECVGPGWRPIILSLVEFAKNESESYEHDMELLAKWEAEKNYCAGWERVTAVKKKYPINPYRYFGIDQTKEKLGSLRCYTHGGTNEFYGAVRLAEILSFKVCEGCGAAGTQTSDGWIKTLCKSCRETRNRGNFGRWNRV